MRNKLKLIYGFFILFVLASCSKEEVLTPSYSDEDRVGNFVDSCDNQYVKDIYSKYNCGLMYEFDPILDFAYTAENSNTAEKWGAVEFTQIKTQFLNSSAEMTDDSLVKYNAYIDKTMTFLDSTLFQYIGDTGVIVDKLPFKVLLAKTIYSPNSLALSTLIESDSRVGSTSIGSLNCAYNSNSIALCVDQDALLYNASKYRKDNFYIFLCRILEMNDLYSQISDDFYATSSNYYDMSMVEVYANDSSIDLTDETEVATIPDTLSKAWFYSKGFIDAKYFYNTPTGLTTIDGVAKVIKKTYYFVEDGDADVRSYLNEAIHRNSTELAAFPDEVKAKLVILVETLEDWGVKIREFNPDLEVLF